jgi:hypothetical protein
VEALLASSFGLLLSALGLYRGGIERWLLIAPALGSLFVAAPSALCQLRPDLCPKLLFEPLPNFIRPITESSNLQPVDVGFGTAIDFAKPLVATAPAVSSINNLDADPTNQATVGYQVQFNQAVNGVSLTSFQLTIPEGNLTGAGLVSVQGSGTTYRVTASTGNGNGKIQLNLIDNDQIKNSSGIPLGGTGANNGNFQGPTYTVNRPVQPSPSPSFSPSPAPQPPNPQPTPTPQPTPPVPALW